VSEKQFAGLGLNVDKVKEFKIGKRPAREWVYSGDIQGLKLTFLAWAVERGDDIYLLTCTSPSETFSKYESIFRESLKTFEFRGKR
jgi:hypothetical protein